MSRSKPHRSLAARVVILPCAIAPLLAAGCSDEGKKAQVVRARASGVIPSAFNRTTALETTIGNPAPKDNHSLSRASADGPGATSGVNAAEIRASLELNCSAGRPEVKGGARALTRYQYRGSLEALLPAPVIAHADVASRLRALSTDLAPKAFDGQKNTLPREAVIEMFGIGREIGLVLANDAAARSAFWNMHGVSCAANVDQPGVRDCLSSALGTFGTRAWRRPLAAAERTRLLALYDGLASRSRQAAFGAVIAAVLQREDFLYRIEGGTAAGVRTRLTPHEVAARLAFGVIGRVPDAALLAEADAGRLDTPERIQSQVTRLLATPEARAQFRHFARQWLNLNSMHVPTDAGLSTAEEVNGYVEAAAGEIAAVFENVLFDSDGSFASLFSTRASRPSHPLLASAYGVAASTSLVTLSDPNRAGVLTRVGALSGRLAAPSAPHRGYNARVNLLCGTIGSIPSGIDLSLPPNGPDVESTRQAWERSHARAACVSCHAQMNPLGFAMEHYDSLGRYRTQETVLRTSNNQPVQVPIDAAATIDFGGGETHAVRDLVDFQAKLGASPLAQACFMGKLFVFAHGSMEGPNCAAKEMSVANATAPQGGLRAAVLRYFLAPEFLEVIKR